jgi:hypothetical protein
MPEALVRQPHSAIRTEVDERLARADLRRQIGRLEHRLAQLVAEAFPRIALDVGVPAPTREPRLIGLAELEVVRDALADRVAAARVALREREALETRNRELLASMLAEPSEHKWLWISRADVGEPGCGGWHSRPRLGVLGMLMGWWQVKVSSGCPLSGRLAAVDPEAAAG